MTDQPETILAVDDTPENLDILVGFLQDQYQIRVAASGERALKMIARGTPPDLILLDIMMPEMSGFEVCRKLKADPGLREIPVIFISALTDASDKIDAFATGGVDYVTKPFHPEEVEARVATHLELSRLRRQLATRNRELERQVARQVEEIAEGQLATIFALSKLAESRDAETGHHLERIQTFCEILATYVREHSLCGGLVDETFVADLRHASPLHDIGKVAIPDSILLKPGRLTPGEFEIMKDHARHGASTLRVVAAKFPDNVLVTMGADLAKSHHEKWDGTGYPDGLKGEQIPLCARIMAVADVYDALRSKRHYKPAFPHERAVEIVREESGRGLDPTLVAAFLQVSEEFREAYAAQGLA